MFKHIQQAPADPILGLTDAFKNETNPQKINLGIGVYKDNNGLTPIVKAIKQAETIMLENEKTKGYLGIDGLAEFNQSTQKLLFGKNSEILASKRAFTAQSLGGTGALRIAAEFIKHQTKSKRVWISAPTWPNHNAIFKAVGMEICDYRYYDKASQSLDWDGMLADLANAQSGDVVLFHGCCHNPTGIDPTLEQWQHLAKMSAEKGWLPLFDFAYQGFANGLEEDAQGLREFLQLNPEMLISSSFSKNFGMYNERVGAFTLVAKNQEEGARAFNQIKSIIRTIYSNPSAHGAYAVATVLANSELKQLWVEELDAMRGRIKEMRVEFTNRLKDLCPQQDFSFIVKQNGMFSFSGLNPQQVERLKNEFGIYIVGSGRINVAGITPDNIARLCECIAKVV